jgi:hypothetical protein
MAKAFLAYLQWVATTTLFHFLGLAVFGIEDKYFPFLPCSDSCSFVALFEKFTPQAKLFPPSGNIIYCYKKRAFRHRRNGFEKEGKFLARHL